MSINNNNNHNDSNNFVIWFIIGVITAGLAPLFIKYSIDTNNNLFIFLALTMYIILLYTYYRLFKTETLVITYDMLKISSILFVTMSGMIIFKETLNNNQICGFILGIISIYLLSN